MEAAVALSRVEGGAQVGRSRSTENAKGSLEGNWVRRSAGWAGVVISRVWLASQGYREPKS